MMDYVNQFLDEDERKEFYKLCMKVELTASKEIDFWSNHYYKLGLSDCSKMQYEMENTLSCYKVNPNKTAEVEKLLNKSVDEISWMVEDEEKELRTTDKYKKMHIEYEDITKRCPRTINAYEDRIPQDLNKEEVAALLKIISQDVNVYIDEMVLAYKIGVRLGASI